MKSVRTTTVGDRDALEDERPVLVQRVASSQTFQKSPKLREFLLFVCECSIRHGAIEEVKEQQIGLHVFHRKPDYNTSEDSIVRVQARELRKRLATYFETEGKHEPVAITIPKGGYLPVFVPAESAAQAEHDSQASLMPAAEAADESVSKQWTRIRNSWTNPQIVLLFLLCMAIALGVVDVLIRARPVSGAPLASVPSANPLLMPLLVNHKSITVILPDTALMVIQSLLGTNVTVGDYLTNFPQEQLKNVSDPALHHALDYLATKRSTTFREALIGSTLVDRLSKYGANATLRFSRDVHVHDLGEGNTVIIGSRMANPWAALFAERTNFRFVENPNNHYFYFVNTRPATGEQSQYISDYSQHDRMVSYVDIALTPNLTDSGSVLLIDGSDVQATEAAARLILGASFPAQVSTLFAHKNLRWYEIFLRGTHINDEADNTFEIIAVRSQYN